MDLTVLNLLFNYKGAITSREFRIGMVVVIMSVGAYLGAFLDTSIVSVIAGRGGGSSWLSTVVVYNQVASFFVPNLVPVLFVISYSSFILAVKRIRMLTNKRALAITSGVLNYLFFASSMALMMINMQVESADDMQHYGFTFVLLLCALFFVGAVNLVYLSIRQSSEPSAPSCSKGKLDVSAYSIKVGNLMWVAASFVIALNIVLACYGKILLLFSTSYFVLGGSAFLFFCFFIKYSVSRLKDAGVSVLWLVCIIVAYLMLFGAKMWLNLYNQSFLTLYYNTVFSIVNSFFILAQFTLFLLPTKIAKPLLNKDSNNHPH